MLDSAALAVFTSAADDFLRSQELVAESGDSRSTCWYSAIAASPSPDAASADASARRASACGPLAAMMPRSRPMASGRRCTSMYRRASASRSSRDARPMATRDSYSRIHTSRVVSIERMSAGSGPAVAECKKLVDVMFRTVRNLALGLRPSMLDDFGLQAALEWHVRDFMGRCAINVELQMDGDFDTLPDKHRTCVYRVVQEALTNCVRHAQATNIAIGVSAEEGRLRVSVSDDGVGLDLEHRRKGLGLRGIDERVKELLGTMGIRRNAAGGTTLEVCLPLPTSLIEVPLARVAG